MKTLPAQMLLLLVAIGTLGISGFILNLSHRARPLASLCRFAFLGISLGFIADAVALSYFGNFQAWILRYTFAPQRLQEVLVAGDDPVYAPVVGMVGGVGIAVLFWFLCRYKQKAEPCAAPNCGPPTWAGDLGVTKGRTPVS